MSSEEFCNTLSYLKPRNEDLLTLAVDACETEKGKKVPRRKNLLSNVAILNEKQSNIKISILFIPNH